MLLGRSVDKNKQAWGDSPLMLTLLILKEPSWSSVIAIYDA